MNFQPPAHIVNAANENPNVTVMEYTYDQVLKPLNADTVASYVKVISTEYLKLLHQTKSSDEEIRQRLKTHEPFLNFAKRYQTIFQKITTRDIVTSPPLMSVIIFQVYLLEQVQSGKMTETQAQHAIAKASSEAVMHELKRKGISPPTMPSNTSHPSDNTTSDNTTSAK